MRNLTMSSLTIYTIVALCVLVSACVSEPDTPDIIEVITPTTSPNNNEPATSEGSIDVIKLGPPEQRDPTYTIDSFEYRQASDYYTRATSQASISASLSDTVNMSGTSSLELSYTPRSRTIEDNFAFVTIPVDTDVGWERYATLDFYVKSDGNPGLYLVQLEGGNRRYIYGESLPEDSDWHLVSIPLGSFLDTSADNTPVGDAYATWFSEVDRIQFTLNSGENSKLVPQLVYLDEVHLSEAIEVLDDFEYRDASDYYTRAASQATLSVSLSGTIAMAGTTSLQLSYQPTTRDIYDNHALVSIPINSELDWGEYNFVNLYLKADGNPGQYLLSLRTGQDRFIHGRDLPEDDNWHLLSVPLGDFLDASKDKEPVGESYADRFTGTSHIEFYLNSGNTSQLLPQQVLLDRLYLS